MIVDKLDVHTQLPQEKAYGMHELPQVPVGLPVHEQPPPYVAGSSSSPPIPTPGIPRSHSVFQLATQQPVNFVTLESKHNAISGSYIINPELPGSAQSHTRILDRREKKRLRHNIVPNATFKTRHGALNLNIATAGSTEQPGKAYVQMLTRHGKVNVNLFALQTNKNICLEILTKHAPITLLIPPNFNGLIRFSTRRGNMQFLKAFAEQARVIYADDEHADVLFGNGDLSQVEPTSEGTDYVSLTSSNGRLTVGICGADPIDNVSGSSLIKKLGTLVLGPELMRSVDMLRTDLLRERVMPPQGPLAQQPHQSSA